jgi:predicted phosphodiesterase
MTLNKTQQSIYDWLLTKDSYLKCSPKIVSKYYPQKAKSKDVQIALEQARIFKKTQKFVNPSKINIIKSSNEDTNNILIIGDTHHPFMREGYLEHLLKAKKDYNCGIIIHIGDVVDNAYSSFHETNPDGHSAGDELEYAIEQLKVMYKEFPKVKVCLGNHDQIINRKAFSAGLSKRWVKGLDEVLEVPGWNFDMEHVEHGVLFTHGTGTSGQNAAYNKALNRRMSVVQGHLHSESNIRYNVSKNDIIYGMQVGCGVDDRKYAFDYAKANPRKFIISCGVILNKGKLPILLPMDL